MAVGLEHDAQTRSHPLAVVAFVLSTLGLVLCLGGVGALILDFIPRYISFDLWFYLVFFSAIGLLVAIAGLGLGLALWLPTRRSGQPAQKARLAVILGAAGITVEGTTYLFAQLFVWLV